MHPKWVVDGDEGDRGGECCGDEVEVMVAAMVVMVLGVNDTMAGVGVVLHSEGYDCGSMGYGGTVEISPKKVTASEMR
ncbi:hypothetical protein Tco_0680359 [Tanacetum coccineum]|uniref:Uncharacterized protein n=1 Tax=Tanacetum coccineum TaxID=301880 RepID=A0ABQ4XL74_9ASTR